MQNLLQEVLSQKKSELEAERPKWDERRTEWITRVNNLFLLIQNWLKSLEDSGYMKISLSDISISEELLGTYSLQKMTITFFNTEKVYLIPIGLHIIGAKGRIDMILGTRKIMIVGNIKDSGWMFSERHGRDKPKMWIFNQDTFTEILTEYAKEF
jgi:hypothetical protein